MILSDIIAKYNPVYPDKETWEDTVTYLMNTPSEAKIVNRLREVIAENNLREAVVIGTGEDDDGSPKKFVFNGTHRMVAYILAGDMSKDIAVLDEDKETIPYEPEETIAFTSLAFERDIDDEFFCFLVDHLRSFELDENFWVEGDASGSKTTFHSSWHLSHAREKDLLPAIHDKICEIVKELGFKQAFVESYWETWTGDTVDTIEKEMIKTSLI